MKRILYILVVIAVAAGSACKKTKGPASVPSVKPDNSVDSLLLMTAIINGSEWRTDSSYSYKVKNSGNDTGAINLLVIATQIKNNVASTISFSISGFTGVKEYIIDPPANSATYYSGNIRYFATSGVFNVKSDTGQILSGTFSFVADTIVVNKGTFSVALP